jgi:hypothetical protein
LLKGFDLVGKSLRAFDFCSWWHFLKTSPSLQHVTMFEEEQKQGKDGKMP